MAVSASDSLFFITDDWCVRISVDEFVWDLESVQVTSIHMGLSENVGYIPNEIAI